MESLHRAGDRHLPGSTRQEIKPLTPVCQAAKASRHFGAIVADARDKAEAGDRDALEIHWLDRWKQGANRTQASVA
jgi:hypothetical protein